MRKKFLSVVLAIAMVFSCIPMSFAVTDPNVSTAKVFSQDGLEGTIDMKAGSRFKFYKQTAINPKAHCEEIFECELEDKEKSTVLNYDGMRLMKVIINIPKKDGLVVNEIIPEQVETELPQVIKDKYPEYFGLQENDTEYKYNFYFKENGIYSFKIKYSIDNIQKEATINYDAKDLVHIECLNMRTALIDGYMYNNIGGYEREYLTKEFLGTISNNYKDSEGNIVEHGVMLAGTNNTIQNMIPLITSLDGVQYFKDNLLEIQLSCGDKGGAEYGFINIDTIKPIANGYYERIKEFRVTELDAMSPAIPTTSYSPELIGDCVKKMPNLRLFYCSGSGFKDFTVFDKLNGKLTNIKCAHNDARNINGIQKHTDLIEIRLQNNKISDVSPLNGAENLKYFWGYNQVVEKDKPVLATVNTDKIRIELPMPIDIDSSLTDVGKIVPFETTVSEANQVYAKYGKETKTYTAFEENSKKYIEINKSDFDNKAEEILENIEFNFNFHNCNGKDNRTKGKFNGKVTFKATLKAPEVAKYNATYSFESATEGKQLPKEVTDLLPNDDKEYEEGNKITALNPNPDKVEVADGIWIFKGYVDKNGNQITEQLANKENANEKGNIHFKGNWEFNEKEKQDATVKYEFVNATPKDNTNPDIDLSKMPIPNEVMNVKPNDTTAYKVGDEVEVKEPETKDFRVTYEDPEKNIKTQMDWQFQGYWVNGKETNKFEELSAGENVFEGRWECKDIDRVSYKFISDDGTVLPDSVLEKIPTPHHDGIYYDNQQIIPQKPESLNIEVDNGTWEFKGWNEEIIEHIHKDTVFVGKWHFTPKDTSGGTTPDKPEIPDKPVTPNKPILPNKPTEPDRVEGDDRIETSIEASKNLFPSGTNAVVLSNCERFTDVLTANTFAIQENASALLTYKDKLPEKTLKEIERLGTKKIYISGGYEAVSKEVVEELISKGYDVFRFDGKDRYDTARKIAIKIREKGNKEVIELASGENFPDALSMTSMAVKDKAPILLTKKDSIPKYTKQALAEWDVENVKIAGLDKAISKEVEKQIDEGFKIDKDKKDDSNVYDGAKSINRFGGKDRYETSTIIAANSCPMSKLGVYATGENFPDALIAGNYAGRKNAPVLLVKRDNLPEVVKDYTEKSDIERITVIGGVNAVSDEVFELIKEAIK